MRLLRLVRRLGVEPVGVQRPRQREADLDVLLVAPRVLQGAPRQREPARLLTEPLAIRIHEATRRRREVERVVRQLLVVQRVRDGASGPFAHGLGVIQRGEPNASVAELAVARVAAPVGLSIALRERARARGQGRELPAVPQISGGRVPVQARHELAGASQPLVVRGHVLGPGWPQRVGFPPQIVQPLEGGQAQDVLALASRLGGALAGDGLPLGGEGRVPIGLRLQDEAGRQPEDEGRDPCREGGRERAVAPDPLLELRDGPGLVGAHDAMLEVGAQVVRQLLHVRVAVPGAARQGLVADRDELGRHVRRHAVERRRRPLLHELPDHPVVVGRPRRHVGRMPAQEVIEHGAERVDVRVRPHHLEEPVCLLGRHVGRRSDDLAVHREQGGVRGLGVLVTRRAHLDGLGRPRRFDAQVAPILGAEHPRQSPVHDVDLTEAPHHHVRGLEVPVDHALGVRVRHGLADLEQHAQGARPRPALPLLVRPLEDRAERPPLHVLHREVDAPLLVEPELVDGNDAGMIQLSRDLRLLEEAPQGARVDRANQLGPPSAHGDDLHGEVAAQVLVPDAQDLALTSVGDLGLLSVAQEGLSPLGEPRDHLGELLSLPGSIDRDRTIRSAFAVAAGASFLQRLASPAPRQGRPTEITCASSLGNTPPV